MTVSMNVSTNQKDNALNSMLMGQSNAEGSAFDAELQQQMQSSRQDLAEATHGYDDFQQQQQDVQTQSRRKAGQLRHEATELDRAQAQIKHDDRIAAQRADDTRMAQENSAARLDAPLATSIEMPNDETTDISVEPLPEFTDNPSDLWLSMIEKSNALQPQVLEATERHTPAGLYTPAGLSSQPTELEAPVEAIPAIFTKPLLEKPTQPSDPRPVDTSVIAAEQPGTGSDEGMTDDLALDAASYWRLKQEPTVQVNATLTQQLEAARQKAATPALQAKATIDNKTSDAELKVENQTQKAKLGEASTVSNSKIYDAAPDTLNNSIVDEKPAQPTASQQVPDLKTNMTTTEQADTATATKQLAASVQQSTKQSEPNAALSDAPLQTSTAAAARSQNELKLKLRGEPLPDTAKESTPVDAKAPIDAQPPVTDLLQQRQLQPAVAELSQSEQPVAQQVAQDQDIPAQALSATVPSSTPINNPASASAGSSAQSAAAEPLTSAEPKPTYAEFMQSSNQQEQQNAANSHAKPEQPTTNAEGMAQSRHDAPVATVEVATSRQAVPMAEIAATSATPSVTTASSHAVHTHVNKLTETLKTAEMTTQQQALDLQQPTAASKLLERVMYQVQQKIQSAEVQLHPEDLGAMQIKLSLQQDQVTVQFLVQNGAAKDAVEQQLSRLKDMLQQQGMQLADGQVEQRQQGQQGDSSQRQSNRTALASQNDAEQVGVVQQGQVQVRISERAVDYYA